MRLIRQTLLLVLIAGAGLVGYIGVQRHEMSEPLWPWSHQDSPRLGATHHFGLQVDVAAAEHTNDGPRANYPGGVSVSLVSITRLPVSSMENTTLHPPSRFTAVKVLIGVNSFAATVPLKQGVFGAPAADESLQLQYGPNLATADEEGGCNSCTNVWSDLPERLGAGGSFMLYGSFDVPTADLKNLVVGVDLFDATDYPGVKFTNAQVVLR